MSSTDRPKRNMWTQLVELGMGNVHVRRKEDLVDSCQGTVSSAGGATTHQHTTGPGQR